MASLAIASPSMPLPRGGSSYVPCGSSVLLDSQPVCCSGDVLDLLDLSCATGKSSISFSELSNYYIRRFCLPPPCYVVSETPKSADDFSSICAESGQTAKCCTITAVSFTLYSHRDQQASSGLRTDNTDRLASVLSAPPPWACKLLPAQVSKSPTLGDSPPLGDTRHDDG